MSHNQILGFKPELVAAAFAISYMVLGSPFW